MKKIIVYLAIVISCLLPGAVQAEPAPAELAVQLSQAQTLANMQIGKYAIPETVLNTYFAAAAQSNAKVKDAKVEVLGGNKFLLTIDAVGVGVLRLTCSIKDFHFNKDNALLELYVEKKELVGQSVASWFLNKLNIGLLTNIYGNPLEGMDSKIKGNTVYINLKPFAEGLFKEGIGKNVADALVIAKATTEPGFVYLHTNCAIVLLAPENIAK